MTASHALSQLSYSPERRRQCTSGANLTRSHGRAPLRPARDRAPLAGGLGARADVAGRQRRGPAAPEVLRARDAALPVRRAAHGAPEELLGRRRGRPLPPPHRPPRAAPDGLRRVRPARREPRDQDRRAPARLDGGVDRASSSASSASGASRSTGRASSAPTSRATTAGRSGSSCSCSSAAWPTARRRRSTGARTTRPCWPTSRSSTGAASAAAPPVEVAPARAVVLPHHRLRRPAARRPRDDRVARARRHDAAQLDRPLRGRRGHVHAARSWAIDYPVFTTRPDTLFGATFFVMAPEHPDVLRLAAGTEHEAEVRDVRQPRADREPRGARRRRAREDRRLRSAGTSSTRSTASGSRCGSPTTC